MVQSTQHIHDWSEGWLNYHWNIRASRPSQKHVKGSLTGKVSAPGAAGRATIYSWGDGPWPDPLNVLFAQNTEHDTSDTSNEYALLFLMWCFEKKIKITISIAIFHIMKGRATARHSALLWMPVEGRGASTSKNTQPLPDTVPCSGCLCKAVVPAAKLTMSW